MKINPPACLLLCLSAMVLVHWRLPLIQVLTPPLSYVGVPLGIVGITVAAASAASFRQAGTGLVPFSPATALVTRGLYRHSRNPMYLGMTLLSLGMALLLGSIAALLPVLGFVIVLHSRFVLPEEDFLEKAFGQAFLDYKSRVRRWL